MILRRVIATNMILSKCDELPYTDHRFRKPSVGLGASGHPLLGIVTFCTAWRCLEWFHGFRGFFSIARIRGDSVTVSVAGISWRD